MTQDLQNRIISLIKAEVVPAIGCTEPMAVALCVAKASELLGSEPSSVAVILSANILKNAMGVGIPGTDMIGLPIAIALGAIAGKSDLRLEVLRDVTPAQLARAKQMVADKRISIDLNHAPCDKLFISVTVTDGASEAKAVIAGAHTRFVHLSKDGDVLLDVDAGCDAASDSAPVLDLATVWEFATETPLDRLRFILEARRLNKAAAEQSFTGTYGHSVGRTLHCERQRAVMGDTIFSRILSYTAAACDARMAGANIPVMSNSGSGNQGIAATLPVVIFAEENFATQEQTVRALVLSHLTAIYIKQRLGRLSALCGCVVAATGSGCGIAYLMGGGYPQIAATVKNMVANLTGMICDGAKPSCAMKLTSGVSTAVISAIMAMESHQATSVEGIIDDDVDRTVANFAIIGTRGMEPTDKEVLRIMVEKQ